MLLDWHPGSRSACPSAGAACGAARSVLARAIRRAAASDRNRHAAVCAASAACCRCHADCVAACAARHAGGSAAPARVQRTGEAGEAVPSARITSRGGRAVCVCRYDSDARPTVELPRVHYFPLHMSVTLHVRYTSTHKETTPTYKTKGPPSAHAPWRRRKDRPSSRRASRAGRTLSSPRRAARPRGKGHMSHDYLVCSASSSAATERRVELDGPAVFAVGGDVVELCVSLRAQLWHAKREARDDRRPLLASDEAGEAPL